ncbi:MAG: glycosyltransferase family 4 protein [Nitrococcus sp.]|nr:glycosyltransferase family 4 protein [Nitrococcus sp.]
MKIAFIAISYIPQRDGVSIYIENLLFELFREMCTQGKQRSFLIDIYVCRESAALLESFINEALLDIGITVTSETLLRFTVSPDHRGLKYLWAAYGIWRRAPYECVVMPNMQPLAFVPNPKLSVLHDLTYKVIPNYLPYKRYLYLDLLTRYHLLRNAAVACISEATKLDLNRCYPGSMRKTSPHLPNGLPLNLVDISRSSLSKVEERLSGATGLDLVFVGRINYLKGFDRVLEVCSVLDSRLRESRIESVTVHVVGKQTPDSQELLASETFQHVKLNICGYVSRDRLHALYANSAYCLFLSRNEGFGLPVIEALWGGCVPILSDIPIFREVMGPGFPLFYGSGSGGDAVVDCMLKVRSDPQYRSEILTMMESALECHRDGYQRAARTLLAWIESTQIRSH